MSRSLRVASWIFLGALLLQTAWILAIPPYRGIDEFDHAYRAASVADGQWLPSGVTPDDGRGELVRVSPGIVRDAEPVCSFYDYTGPDNCNAVDVLDDGSVTVASAASRYHPAFYFVVGTVAQPFDGAGALYVMRFANALLCSLMLAGAALVTLGWARSRWPVLALVGTLTPVAAYSTAVPGPNGVEMLGALGLWVSLLGLARVEDPTHLRRLLMTAGAFAVPLTSVRGLGPLWLAAICFIALVHLGPSRIWQVVRAVPRTAAACAAVVLAAGLGSVAWILSQPLAAEGGGPYPDPVLNTLRSVPLWFLQSVAAFPTRNEPAHPVVYATGCLAVLALCVFAAVRGSARQRLTLLLAFVAALTVPAALTVATYSSAGAIWQGRYGWPLSMGVLLLAGAVLDERAPRHRLVNPVLAGTALLWIVTHAVSVADVALGEQQGSVLAGDDRWITAPGWLLGVVAAAGVAAWCRGCAVAPGISGSTESVHRGEPAPELVAA